MVKRSSKKNSPFRNKVKKDAESQGSGKSAYYLTLPDGIKLYSPSAGEREKIDIIPYEVTEENHLDKDVEMEKAIPGTIWYKRPFRVHRDIGPDEERVICPTTFGEKCPICEYKKKASKNGADYEDIKHLNYQNRNLYAVIPIGNSDYDEEIHLFDISQAVFQTELNKELDEDEDYELFPDLEDGYTLKVRWDEKKFGKVKYPSAGKITFLSRDEAYDEDIMESIPDLGGCLKRLSYEELEALFLQMETSVSDEDDDEDDDDEPRAKRSKKTAKRSPKKTKKEEPEEEEDEDDDEPPFDTDDEEEEEDELTWEDLSDMEEAECEEVIEHYELELDLDDYEDDLDGLREAIAEEMEIEVEKPKKKTPAKRTRKAAPKPEPKKKTSPRKTGNKCPHGHIFGIEVDEHEECDGCKVYKACSDKFDEEE